MWARPLVKILVGLSALVFVVAGWFALQIDPIFAGRGREVIITVDPGDSMSTIAAKLHARGVIASPLAFRIEDVVLGSPLVRPGQYGLRQGSSFASVRFILGQLPNVVTVPAGFTIREVVNEVRALRGGPFAGELASELTATVTASPFVSGTSLEGLIGPGQYVIAPETTPRDLARQMVRAFSAEAKSVGLTAQTTVATLRAYQIIVAASIVQKEGYYPRNMPKVARVVLNRLRRGGPLQMDATVLYALGRDGGIVTHAMEDTPSPYNTYLNSGLPPTPICTVSPTALRAVLHAPPGPWLYFTVVDARGDEAFATTFAQQLRNEQLATSRGAP